MAANYRAARRAKSTADFINKLKIVEEELDESLFFLELLFEFNQKEKDVIIDLFKKGEELLKLLLLPSIHPDVSKHIVHHTSNIVH